MSLKQQIKNDIIGAMRSGDKERRDAIRMIQAAVRQVEIDDKIEADDALVLSILIKQAKQRRESISEYEKAGRDDLSVGEKVELAIIEEYLPKQLGEEDISKVIKEKLDALDLPKPVGIGDLMGIVMSDLKGKADGRLISKLVKELLAKHNGS